MRLERQGGESTASCNGSAGPFQDDEKVKEDGETKKTTDEKEGKE